MKKLKILIADDEEDLRDILSFFTKSLLHADILQAKDGSEAMCMISEQPIDLIICDYNMPVKNGGDVYVHLLSLNSKIPYVLCSSEIADAHTEYTDRSLLFEHIVKPDIRVGHKRVIEKFKALISYPDPETYEYTPISIRILRSLGELPSDMFIRISEQKYLKVFTKGMQFDENDLQKYSGKNVTQLYADSLGVDAVKDFIENRLLALKSTGEKRLDVRMQMSTLVMASFRDYGYNERFLPIIEQEMKETLDFCRANKSMSQFLERLLSMKDTYIGKHVFMLSAISVGLALRMGWNSQGTTKKLLMSAFFHDIFLDEDHIESLLLKSKPAVLSDSFKNHAQKAATFIDSIPGMLADIGRIILEQHEIGPEFGYPTRSDMSRMSPLGQLFAFAHYLVDQIVILEKEGSLSKDTITQAMSQIGSTSPHCKKFLKIIQETNFIF